MGTGLQGVPETAFGHQSVHCQANGPDALSPTLTAEIAILNKGAVALAADSAVTIQIGGGQKIYNTVNKLFTLSKYQPVGAMIYGNSEFMGVPWESIIKEYRRELGK